ncbi:uncharacterized protein LOC116431864 isoform X2 [Nomia melanderi]|nr:uncharacterized protein LOC116431864 isoform X2 [Nomia melanderi]XP_031843743.1 uncharacterized protein LOC116431864 isoform X2 [Nomia melanderi]XP_031843744.1 uncharacterized protein LOC116431864 isoform X2 [Nomia melanderi]XP_031843745.1 uncharacterized protein LOC116431864 isoform X2 [Nomia melanderi]XP_031843747.1 uncharacterized protein LOC116431864 isoform X2 [Nomia melanderi]XP_031843748.1 uncharacterized protein LOC116431864 isoform X2 [Nomia melanderi]
MESEQRYYELRSGSRSRSQTPSVQAHALIEAEIAEHHYDLRNRSRERSGTPGEIISSKKSAYRMLSGTGGKLHDQSMETIMERKGVVPLDTLSENHNKRQENSSTGIKKAERRSERQKAKREILENGQNEKKDDSFYGKYEIEDKNISAHRTITSDYSSEEGEKEDVTNRPSTAHEIYKQAGDWWNVFPKTDYTYSEKSQCRYEIAPGILAMPNMSRRSIHSDGETFDQVSHQSGDPSVSVTREAVNFEDNAKVNAENSTCTSVYGESKIRYTKTHVERHRSQKEMSYTVPRGSTNSRSRQFLRSDSLAEHVGHAFRKWDTTPSVDSDTELDCAVSMSSRSEKGKLSQRFGNFTSIIVSWFNSLFEFLKLKTVRRRDYRGRYDYSKHESRWYKVWQYIDCCLQYVYMFMVKVFFFDSWLLSRVSSVRKWMQQRSPKVLWIALLPLLFLTGSWCLPYFSTSFQWTDHAIVEQSRDRHWSLPQLFLMDERSFPNGEASAEAKHFKTLAEKLHARISKLEDQTIEQASLLLNVNGTLEKLKDDDFVWSKFHNKMLSLQKTIEDRGLVDAYAQEIEAMKLQLNALKELYSEVKLCCNTRANLVGEDNLEKRVETILAEYFHVPISKKDSTKAIRDAAAVTADGYNSDTAREGSSVASDERVREIVKDALRTYDADKTGRVDYALESAGGQIISIRCTQKYDRKTRAVKFLAFMVYQENNNPRTVIQGNPIQPGVCWAFQGFPGYLLIKLRSSIYVTGFTVEHVPKSILPNGEMRSAPKKFNVWGFVNENDPVPVMFGDYEFAATDDNLQYFPVQNTAIETPYEFVELRVNSNHGQLDYTCLYRFRVHGRPV